VSVVVIGEPVTETGEGIAQVGGSTAPDGPPVTAQLIVTCPVKPPFGEMVIVELPLAPGDAMVAAVLLSVNPGAAGTITVKLVVAFKLPAAPVAVTV
jgi:hypothetical protein